MVAAPMSGSERTGERHHDLANRLRDDAEELAEFVSALVAVPSVTGAEGDAAQFVAEWLDRNGFEVDRHYIGDDDLARWPDCGSESDLARRPNIVGRLRSANPVCSDVVLNGHLDVVPTGDPERWARPVFGGVRADGRIHGRGAADMKAGIGAGLFALRAVRDAGIDLPFDVQVQCVVAEESGGLGTRSLMRDQSVPSAALVLEPTSSRVVTACGGAQPFTVQVTGRAAHVGNPWTGVDALDKLMLVHERLRRLERDRAERLSHPLFDELPRKAPLSVGKVEAGEWRLTIPADARWYGRIGTLPFEDIDDVRAELLAAVSELESDSWLRDHPCTVTFDGSGFAGWESDPGSTLVTELAAAAAAAGGNPAPTCATYGSDASVFARMGAPVALFGPGSLAEAHCTDESVAEADITYVAQVVAATVVRLASTSTSRAAEKEPTP